MDTRCKIPTTTSELNRSTISKYSSLIDSNIMLYFEGFHRVMFGRHCGVTLQKNLGIMRKWLKLGRMHRYKQVIFTLTCWDKMVAAAFWIVFTILLENMTRHFMWFVCRRQFSWNIKAYRLLQKKKKKKKITTKKTKRKKKTKKTKHHQNIQNAACCNYD